MPRRTLSLKREALAELTVEELRGVAAADGEPVYTERTICEMNRCISKLVSCFYC